MSPTINLENVDLFYLDIGSGTPVLLIHGLTLSGSMWKPQVEYLARSFRLIIPDLRGHGRSAVPEHGYTIHDYASDIKQLVSQLKLHEFHIIGISLGGAIATKFSAAYPRLLLSTTVISPMPPRFITEDDWDVKITEFREVMAKDGVKNAIENVLLKEPIFGKIKVKLSEWINLKKAIKQFSGYPLNEKISTIDDYQSVMEMLKTYYKPFMIISGENDTNNFHDAANALKTVLPKAQKVSIENAGHLCTIEQPKKLNRILNNFLISAENKRKSKHE